MKHIDQELLWDLVTGDAEVEVQANALDHLNICDQCKNEYALIQAIHQESYNIEHDSPSMRFSVSVKERIEEVLKIDSSILFWGNIIKSLIVGSVILVLIICLIILGSNQANPLENIPNLDRIILIITGCCIGLWVFYLMDRILHKVYSHN